MFKCEEQHWTSHNCNGLSLLAFSGSENLDWRWTYEMCSRHSYRDSTPPVGLHQVLAKCIQPFMNENFKRKNKPTRSDSHPHRQ
jgi:hypothetical protein